MDNKGCIVALTYSVKFLLHNLEQVKGQIDQKVYESSLAELNAMNSLMQELLRDGGPGLSRRV